MAPGISDLWVVGDQEELFALVASRCLSYDLVTQSGPVL
jgi:hypothetical protein